MKQQEILQELKKHGGSLAEAAAKEIETLAAQMPEWIDVKESLPKATDKYGWVPCIVTVLESRYPTSPYDNVDSPYDQEFVSSALFAAHQNLWHIRREEAGMTLNALIGIEDAPLNGYCVTHWMPLPGTPEEGEKHETMHNKA